MSQIILDCDTGEDDALAIMIALANKLPLRAVVSSYGNTTLENATKNSADILSLAEAPQVVVLPGSEGPMKPHKIQPNYSAGDFVGKNGLCNTVLPLSKYQNVRSVTDDNFVAELADIIKHEKTTYIITGPCTNFAKVCQYFGDATKQYIDKVYVMGGAVYAAGNSGPPDPQSHERIAEFNFYCDPYAADIVLASGLPIHLVTWDITSTIIVPFEIVQNLQATYPTGKFAAMLMRNFFKYYGLAHDRSFELNDPITVLACLGWGNYHLKHLRVRTTKSHFGQSVLDSSGYPVFYFVLDEQQKAAAASKILADLCLTPSSQLGGGV